MTSDRPQDRTANESELDPAAARAWANARGYAVAARGRLPRFIVEAFLEGRPENTYYRPSSASKADESHHRHDGGGKAAQSASKAGAQAAVDYPPYELLAKHLDSRFGNIYEYNLGGGNAGEEPQAWTDELREAVRRYLLTQLPDAVGVELFGLDVDRLGDYEAKRSAVDDLLAVWEPWEVALQVREAAVMAISTLDKLIGHHATWPSGDERADAEFWLEKHTTVEQQQLLANELDAPASSPFDLVHDHEPSQLLQAWRGIVDSDLTDAEWELIQPFLPVGAKPPNSWHLSLARRALDGMLYWSTHGKRWKAVPSRYGKSGSIKRRFDDYQERGVFHRMLEGLQDRPQANRIVQWLRPIVGGEWITRLVASNGIVCVARQQVSVGPHYRGKVVHVHVTGDSLEVWVGQDLLRTVTRTSTGQVRKKRAMRRRSDGL